MGQSISFECVRVFQCSTSCGEGVQQREVRCVREEDMEQVTDGYCDTEPKPVTRRTCKTQPCHDNNPGIYASLFLAPGEPLTSYSSYLGVGICVCVCVCVCV